jgi:hypothetical protein
VGPRTGVDGYGKSRSTGIRSPDRPARSQSLYRLSYPGPQYWLLNDHFTVNITESPKYRGEGRRETRAGFFLKIYCEENTVRSESRCALRLRYVDLVVSIEVAVEVCCCFAVFIC